MAIGRNRTGRKIAATTADHEHIGPERTDSLQAVQRQRLWVESLRLLALRPRTEKQLREKLLSKLDCSPEDIDSCIQALKESGLINDRKFGENYASYKSNLKPMGRARMARELAGKKLSRADVNAALDEVYDAGAEGRFIDRAIEKHLRIKGTPSSDSAYRRLYAYLSRLGFSYDLISDRIRSLRHSTHSETDD